MSAWKQVGENLVQHESGTIYVRAKVAGKIVRKSLETSDLRIAKLRRDDKIEKLRAAAKSVDITSARTLGDIVAIVESRMAQPHLKESTREYYSSMAEILRQTMPISRLGKKWGKSQATQWWKEVAKKYAPQRANNLLSAARQVGAALVESGMALEDPTHGLKRMRITKKQLSVPSRDELEEIIQSIRSQGKRASKASALYVAFLAYSGCRHQEAAAVEWRDLTTDWLVVTGGQRLTKNYETRRVPLNEPLNEPLRAVIEELRHPDASGPIFHIKTPRIALDNACERLGVDHLRIHDLRHFFATWCIESGIEIPTVAKWLGHKDGGVLAMKTYGHLRDDHSLASAKKLT